MLGDGVLRHNFQRGCVSGRPRKQPQRSGKLAMAPIAVFV
jgi:hypothetical protein